MSALGLVRANRLTDLLAFRLHSVPVPLCYYWHYFNLQTI